jgi:hypothetical protein
MISDQICTKHNRINVLYSFGPDVLASNVNEALIVRLELGKHLPAAN